jgi:dipeptidase D
MSVNNNLNIVDGIAPERVWKHFAEIAAIPRCSGDEEEVGAFIESFAEKHGLGHDTDETGNVVIRKPAHTTMDDAPAVVLQGHLDMVCEKNQGVDHDFSVDPVTLVRDGEWLRAKETTLGADNGIAIAMILALLEDPEAVHGPLEALFTVDEEEGLIGAANLAPDFVKGRRLINLDSEEEGVFYIGCAGGQNTEGRLPMHAEPAGAGISAGIAVTVSVTGLRGGHSGSDIHEGRGNAIGLCVRFLRHAARKIPLRLYAADGGGLHNAIPREMFAGIVIGADDYSELEKTAVEYAEIYRAELGDIEPELQLKVGRASKQPSLSFSSESTDRLLDTLFIIPHGVTAMSRKINGLVDSSTNLAAVHLSGTEAHILTSQRSVLASVRDDLADHITAIVERGGGIATYSGVYPSWPSEPDSALIRLCRETYARLFGKEPCVTAIHAGLECGVLGEKFTDSSMVSFGPDILGAHTPREHVNITSTRRIWRLLLEVLKALRQ